MNYNSATTPEYIIGFLSIIIFFYRAFFVMLPMTYDGIKKNNMSLIMKSFTMLV